MNTLLDVIQDLKQDIESTENAIVEPNLYVVIWESYSLPDDDPINTTYALCNRVVNNLAEQGANDIISFPTLNSVKFVTYHEASRIMVERPMLYNGRNDRFRSGFVKATVYKAMLVKELKRQLASLESCRLRHE